MIWQQAQKNDFYGECTELSVTAEGLVKQSRCPLNAGASMSQDASRLLEPVVLQQLKTLLQQFMSFYQVYPVAVIPDDFPWVCQVKLGEQEQQLKIYSNSPSEQRELLSQIQSLISVFY